MVLIQYQLMPSKASFLIFTVIAQVFAYMVFVFSNFTRDPLVPMYRHGQRPFVVCLPVCCVSVWRPLAITLSSLINDVEAYNPQTISIIGQASAAQRNKAILYGS